MVLFDVAVQKFLKNLAQKSKIRKGYVSEATTETYTGILDKFRVFTKKKELAEVTQDDVMSFLVSIKDQGTSGTTVSLTGVKYPWCAG